MLQGCRRFCSYESLRLQQIATALNERFAPDSISINYEQQNSAAFDRKWNLVRDQGVGGSNPLSPTIYFQRHTAILKNSAPKPLGFGPGALAFGRA
jgi:hypothetical protein